MVKLEEMKLKMLPKEMLLRDQCKSKSSSGVFSVVG